MITSYKLCNDYIIIFVDDGFLIIFSAWWWKIQINIYKCITFQNNFMPCLEQK